MVTTIPLEGKGYGFSKYGATKVERASFAQECGERVYLFTFTL